MPWELVCCEEFVRTHVSGRALIRANVDDALMQDDGTRLNERQDAKRRARWVGRANGGEVRGASWWRVCRV